VGYQQLAEDGFAVLGERLRSGEERQVVAEVLQKVLGAKVSPGATGGEGWEGEVGLIVVNAAWVLTAISRLPGLPCFLSTAG